MLISTNDVKLEPVHPFDMRGSSDAVFALSERSITKIGSVTSGAFVRNQGVWLARRDECGAFPAVEAVYPAGYRMERLWLGDMGYARNELCDLILKILIDEVWHFEYDTSPSHVHFVDDRFEGCVPHESYLKKIVKDVHGSRPLRVTLRNFARTIEWSRLRKAYAHGDPIIDNLLWRWNAGKFNATPVLIDPIPATSALPDLEAIDVGRLIQSAVGYELVRYGINDNLPSVPDAVNHVLHAWLDDFKTPNALVNARAALHFAIIHMIRGVRTAQRCAPHAVGPLWNVTYDLIEEAKLWMR